MIALGRSYHRLFDQNGFTILTDNLHGDGDVSIGHPARLEHSPNIDLILGIRVELLGYPLDGKIPGLFAIPTRADPDEIKGNVLPCKLLGDLLRIGLGRRESLRSVSHPNDGHQRGRKACARDLAQGTPDIGAGPFGLRRQSRWTLCRRFDLAQGLQLGIVRKGCKPYLLSQLLSTCKQTIPNLNLLIPSTLITLPCTQLHARGFVHQYRNGPFGLSLLGPTDPRLENHQQKREDQHQTQEPQDPSLCPLKSMGIDHEYPNKQKPNCDQRDQAIASENRRKAPVHQTLPRCLLE